jgi:hypothetical protein
MYQHRVSEEEVEEILAHPVETRRGDEDSVILTGKTWRGRFLRVIVSFDEDRLGCFVITAYDVQGKPLKALRRRMRKRGQSS